MEDKDAIELLGPEEVPTIGPCVDCGKKIYPWGGVFIMREDKITPLCSACLYRFHYGSQLPLKDPND